MDLLLPVPGRPAGRARAPAEVPETTALGAAYLAGLAEGVWSTPDELARYWRPDAEFTPAMGRKDADRRQDAWRRAVDRTRSFGA